MRAFMTFNRGLLRMPIPVKAWLCLLVLANLVVPSLWFSDRLEAQVAVVTMVGSMLLMTGLTTWAGFTRLLGLGHMLWIPMLLWLWSRLDEIPPTGPFGSWVRLLMIVNAISLIMDVVDVGRYLAGEREDFV